MIFKKNIKIKISSKKYEHFAEEICIMIEESAKVRGTGIAKKDPNYIREKIIKGEAVIATLDNKLIGFCYIETWQNKEFIVNSGLIVHPDYRNFGIAKKIKKKIFNLTRKKFPNSKIFGITTSLPVMNINSDLGYVATTFSTLPKDKEFWDGCRGCVNYDILEKKEFKFCLCNAMIYIPKKESIFKKIFNI